MNRRASRSGGQALVMVTLALIAMMGIIGLTVDLGWSYFVRKQAQTAADAAALGAAQQAETRLRTSGSGAVSAFTCGSSLQGTSSGQVDCQSSTISCGAVTSTSNLNNGCQYAIRNGFDPRQNSSQTVYVRSGDQSNNPVPGVNLISYWVTVTTVQTVPQLFSAVLGNTTGTVSASATAGIVGVTVPASFYGMNRVGEQSVDVGSNGNVRGIYEGLDFITSPGGGSGSNTNCPGGGSGNLCAPNGIILASDCRPGKAGCTYSSGYTGDASQGPGVVTGSLTIMGQDASNGGVIKGANNIKDSSGNVITPTYSTKTSDFADPMFNNPQPPVPSGMPTCGVNATLNNVTLGPYQYYHYSNINGTNQFDGQPITVTGSVNFAANGTCPGVVGGTRSGTAFPTYVFYGGLVQPSQNDTINMGAGIYVAAGVLHGNPDVFYSKGVITGDSTTGTLMVFTDGQYPGLNLSQSLQNQGLNSMWGTWAQSVQLDQGTIDIKNAKINMTGLTNNAVNSSSQLPDSMEIYSGYVWWQDRRNSFVEYNKDPGLTPSSACPNCTKDNGTVLYSNCYNYANSYDCGAAGDVSPQMLAENHVTSSSPGSLLNPGNGYLNLNGVYYQPRGASMSIVAGNANIAGTLRVYTGALLLDQGVSNMLLNALGMKALIYRAALIQ